MRVENKDLIGSIENIIANMPEKERNKFNEKLYKKLNPPG
jgi:hypothetical protein